MVEFGGKISMMQGGPDNYITLWFEGVEDPLIISKELYKEMGSPHGGTTWKITIEPIEEPKWYEYLDWTQFNPDLIDNIPDEEAREYAQKHQSLKGKTNR